MINDILQGLLNLAVVIEGIYLIDIYLDDKKYYRNLLKTEDSVKDNAIHIKALLNDNRGLQNQFDEVLGRIDQCEVTLHNQETSFSHLKASAYENIIKTKKKRIKKTSLTKKKK